MRTQQDAREAFRGRFRALTGHSPLSWQVRLYEDYFSKGRRHFPQVIDLPTGLGKTMVMAIWLVARERLAREIPPRLVYVVGRRTVVDQATDLAKELQERYGAGNLAISSLRRQLADNREWSRDPSRPAIVIGTVDLIGSGLLFTGYRSSFKRRPLEAGLLGEDSLLVLDEAHLSRPFEKLMIAISQFQRCNGDAQGQPMRVIRMSATSGCSADSTPAFTLQFDAKGNLTGEDANDKNVVDRFCAKKRLMVVTLGGKESLTQELADKAIELATNDGLIGKRIAVFVRKPDDARAVAQSIRSHIVESIEVTGSNPKKIKTKPYEYDGCVKVLTGTMRGLERDELVERPVFKERWLNGELRPDDPANQEPVFLICTSAGEVGFDLNADHMVCDATTIDSLIQRLGRVNRRGLGDAQICLIVEPPKVGKDGKPKKLEGLDRAIANTIDLLQGVTDVSPKNIAALKSGAWSAGYADASSPDIPTAELTDILLDAWSMTSITGPMPGRPEVGPWLRGLDEDQPQTTIAWRVELEPELLKNCPEPAEALQRIFAKHPIRPHESLTVNTGYVLEFLKRIATPKDRPSDLALTQVAVRLPRAQVECRTLQQLAVDPRILYAEPTLIFPAKFGGLNAAGMLDADAIPRVLKADEAPRPSLDVADQPGFEQRDEARPRLRLLIRRTDDGGWAPESLPGGVAITELLQLRDEYPTSTELFEDLRRADSRKERLRVRLVQPITSDEEGNVVRSFVALTPASNRSRSEDQTLDEHVGAVVAEAERIADALGLNEEELNRVALLFAARWHDEGKKAEIWQRFANRRDGEEYKGKSSKTRDPKSLLGYRHEFGSLLRAHFPDRCETIDCVHPEDAEARELALHLIATHHGLGRPHFPMAVYRGFSQSERDDIHAEAIRRFGRLQRKYGWWRLAWLENLLRCADALASPDQESEDDPGDTGGEEL